MYEYTQNQRIIIFYWTACTPMYTPLHARGVYKGEAQPFKSKLQASKELGISTKTITKYENTNSYKDLYFFNTKQ